VALQGERAFGRDARMQAQGTCWIEDADCPFFGGRGYGGVVDETPKTKARAESGVLASRQGESTRLDSRPLLG